MKLHLIKPSFILVLMLSLMMAGCLKDKAFDNGQIQSFHGSSTKVISLGINVLTQQNFSLLAFDNSTNDTTVNLIPVELGGPDVAPQDIHVTLQQADNLVDSLNAANLASGVGATDFTVPDSSKVTIISTIVTIKKSTRPGYLQVKL